MRQPNQWSCLPCSLSHVTNIPLDLIIKNIGHDGSQILWPNSPEPYNRRGFHIQEIILCAHDFGFGLVPFEPECISLKGLADPYHFREEDLFRINNRERIAEIIFQSTGILVGIVQSKQARHAIGWNNGVFLDSGGFDIQTFDDFFVESFWRLIKS